MTTPAPAHWAPLNPERAQARYGIAPALTAAPGTTLYELSSQAAHQDGPWSLLAVRRDPTLPHAVRIEFATLDAEQAQRAELDPFQHAPGYLLLNKNGVTALIALLQALPLAPAPDAPAAAFRPLAADEVAEQGAGQEVFEGHRQSFHLQLYTPDPAGPAALLILSAVLPLPAWWLYLSAKHPVAPGAEHDATPRGAAVALHVDQRGLDYLVAALTGELPHLVEQGAPAGG